MQKRKVISIVGARPQFVKLGPIVRSLDQHEDIDHKIVHTGQHYDDRMSRVFFEQLKLPQPDVNLNVGSGSHGSQTAAMLSSVEQYLVQTRPDAVLVYGDTNSTLAATLAAAKIHVPIAHVEAGLRSHNRSMPEEINRIVADHCSGRLYAPTPRAMRNLESENLGERAMFSGDVMRDAIDHNRQLAEASTVLKDLGLNRQEFGLVTIHRPANTCVDAFEPLLKSLRDVATQHFLLVMPVHPRTKSVLSELGIGSSGGVRLIEPLPYLDMIMLLEAAAVVITDSGGVQKEAAFLHTPCVTVRSETEWTETVSLGINSLVDVRSNSIADTVAKYRASSNLFGADVLAQLDACYGRGDAADRIITDCKAWLT